MIFDIITLGNSYAQKLLRLNMSPLPTILQIYSPNPYLRTNTTTSLLRLILHEVPFLCAWGSVELCPELGFYSTLITGNPSFHSYLLLFHFSLGYLYRHYIFIFFLVTISILNVSSPIYNLNSMYTLLSVVTMHLTESKCFYTFILLYFFTCLFSYFSN